MAFNQLNALDFNDIKASIKDYIKSSEIFTDYNFEGSVISNIVDILAYNTYYNAFNANLIVNEAFLDSAILRENVVRLAKLLNYVPRSKTSSQALVNITVTLPTSSSYPDTLTLKSGVAFNAFNENGNFIFSVLDDVVVAVNKTNGTATFNNVQIYEGNLLNTRYVVDTSSLQKYIVPNPNADTNTLKVKVFSTPQSNSSDLFVKANDFIGLTSDSKVYFLQEVEDQKFELIFGDDVFGKKLVDNNVIDFSYIICNGKLGNNCSDFTGGFIGRIIDNNNNNITSGIVITNVQTSIGGGDAEGIDSIKYYAPKYFQSQGRAVTAKDYEVIVPTIYPNIDSISVYGGEDELPPQYGTVNLVIKPKTGFALSATEKNKIKQLLKNYSVASVTPVIKDPSVIYINISSFVYYNPLLTTNSSDTIKQNIINTIVNLNTTRDFNKFNGKFKYSRLTSLIDNAESSITSNITKIKLKKVIPVSLNIATSYLTCYANVIAQIPSKASLTSSGFKISGQDQTQTFYFEDNSSGKINIYSFDTNGSKKYLPSNSVKGSYGSINYVTGEVIIDPINITGTSNTDNTIDLYVIPESNDIVAIRDTYLTLDTNNLNISIIEDIIASGQTTSGIGVIPASSQQ